ncbi:MAG TPA: M20/M25/M40 family metallo-hydrolase [Arenimonas sp.]|nr:M20/M25/M40 family metallo-hydrolase [Arenimonas sp.]
MKIKKSPGALLALAVSVCFSAQAADPKPDAGEIQQANELLSKIISIPTVAGRGQVSVMADYLAQRLIKGGFAPDDVSVVPMDGTAYLTARYRGNGSKRAMLISDHMDVVEAKREDWIRDPFVMESDKDYHYGRGTSDNKFDVAMVIQTLLRLKREGFVPSRDIILVFSGDEETSMKTTAALAKLFPQAEFLINGDGGGGTLDAGNKPLTYSLQTAEKSYASFTLAVSNPGGHSSRPRADNAIYQLADALKKVQAYRFPVMSMDTTRSFFDFTGKQVGGDMGAAMRRFAADPKDAGAIAAISADAGYNATLRTTCVATMLQGGHADNALPQKATATVNCRIFPGVTVDSVRNTLIQTIADPAVAVTVIDQPFSSDPSPMRDDIQQAVRKAVDANFAGLPIVPEMSTGATDSQYFRAVGIPSYGVSSLYMRNEDAYAHGLNERVPVSATGRGLTHWHVLLKELAK